MADMCAKRWVIYKQRISKGDLVFEDAVQTFASENDARACLEKYREQVSPAWPDWDDYALREETD